MSDNGKFRCAIWTFWNRPIYFLELLNCGIKKPIMFFEILQTINNFD